MSTKLQTVIKCVWVLIVIVHWTACALKLVTEYTLNECDYEDCPQTILTSTSNYRDGIWAQYVEACCVGPRGDQWDRTRSAKKNPWLEMDTRFTSAAARMLMGIIVMAFLIGDLSNIMSNLDRSRTSSSKR